MIALGTMTEQTLPLKGKPVMVSKAIWQFDYLSRAKNSIPHFLSLHVTPTQSTHFPELQSRANVLKTAINFRFFAINSFYL